MEGSLQLIRPFFCAAVALAFSSVAPAFAADNSSPDYRVTKSIVLGSGERWDYVTFDPTGKRVYVAHGDHVTVVDETKGEVIGQIGTFPGGTHGIAVSAETNQATQMMVKRVPRLPSI